MAENTETATVAPDEPGGEVFIINGEEVTVPRVIEGEGREAVQRWVDAQVARTGARPPRPAVPAKPTTTDAQAEG